MYASNKKDINRNKSFHALSGKNIARREELKGQKRDRDEEAERRLQQIEKERRDAKLDDLFDQADGVDVGNRARDRAMAWMDDAPTAAAGGAASAPPKAESAPSASTTTATESATGLVTKEEAEEARKRLSDEKKRRLDPLARASEAVDDTLRLRALQRTAASAAVSSAPATNQQQRLQNLLSKMRK